MLVVDRKPCTISLEDSLHMHGSMPFYVKDLSSRGFWYLRRVPKATPRGYQGMTAVPFLTKKEGTSGESEAGQGMGRVGR